ncbi:MAG: patatin-like phospholipase family protein [Burkholderiaceae bacterium]
MHRIRPFFVVAALMALAGCQTLPSSSVVTSPQPERVEAPVIQPAPRPPRIGLALGGGAARGFAHIGVIKALEAQGVQVDIVAGTSAGSVVGALYANGYNGFELQKMALQMDEATMADWASPISGRGLIKGEALQNYINSVLRQRPIEQLPRKFAAVAADLKSGEMVVFERGNTGMAVRASSSVPGVFQPVPIRGREYVDGGLVSPVPARAARQMGADVVIAVDISTKPGSQTTDSTTDVVMQTFNIMGQAISSWELAEAADVVIRPHLATTKSTDFAARNLSILEGERAAAAQRTAIAAAITRAQARIAAQP